MAGTPIDVTNYQSWQTVKTPEGGVLYLVPNSEWAYDPILSASKGRNVFRRNPKPALDEQQRQRDLREQAANPINQLVPVAGSVGGLVLGKYAVDNLLTKTPEVVNTVKDVATGATSAAAGATGAATGATTATGALSGGVGPFMQGGSVPAAPVVNSASRVGGSALGAAAPYLGLAGAGLGAYGVSEAIKNRDAGAGAISGAGTGVGLAAAAPLLGLGPVGWLGFGAAALGGGAVGGLLTKLFGHKGTKEYQKERWGGLQEKGIRGASQAYALNHPEGDDSTWKSGKYAGEKWTMEKALDLVKDDPTHFHHVYGNYKTFGNDWSGYSEQQKSAIVSRLAQEGLYKGNKGDVVISDEERARKIKDEILGGVVKPAPEAEMGKKLADRRNQRR